jgi:hypothetical protein
MSKDDYKLRTYLREEFSKTGLVREWIIYHRPTLEDQEAYVEVLVNTAMSQIKAHDQALLDRIEKEIIGEDIDENNYGWKNFSAGAPQAINIILSEQRQALARWGEEKQ